MVIIILYPQKTLFISAKRVSAVQCCIIPLHISACVWLKATGLGSISAPEDYIAFTAYWVLSEEKRAEFGPLCILVQHHNACKYCIQSICWYHNYVILEYIIHQIPPNSSKFQIRPYIADCTCSFFSKWIFRIIYCHDLYQGSCRRAYSSTITYCIFTYRIRL